MVFLKLVLNIFLLPGTLVINKIGITVEEDGGIIRSFINMMFWGTLMLLISLPFIVS